MLRTACKTFDLFAKPDATGGKCLNITFSNFMLLKFTRIPQGYFDAASNQSKSNAFITK